MKVVLDSGVFMNQIQIPNLNSKFDFYMTKNTITEIKSVLALQIFELFREEHRISFLDPLPKYLKQVVDTARNIGQEGLSEIDTEVLALALMLTKDSDILLLSEDYALRNVAHELKIPSKSTKTKGGNKKRKYKFKCKGCGTIFPNKSYDCDICGSLNFIRLKK